MADSTLRIPGGDDCEGERGERGHRGHRGHDGHDGHDGRDGDTGSTGPTGFTGPTGPGATARSLVKFSGVIGPVGNMFLADTGTVPIVPPNGFPDYPVPSARNLFNLATNIGAFVVPPNGSIAFEVVANGALVPGYLIVYTDGEFGVKSISFGPVALPINGTFDLRVTPMPGTTSVPIPVSATIEIE